MTRANLHGEDWDDASTRPGFSWRAARIGRRIGGRRIGGTVYALDDGERSFPYHYHHGVEEWCYVIEGTPTLRTPRGERTLRAGDLVCFRSGPDGAHVVRGPGRILMLSAGGPPSVSVYPDSDKLGTRPGVDADRLNFRRADGVDYWEGE